MLSREVSEEQRRNKNLSRLKVHRTNTLDEVCVQLKKAFSVEKVSNCKKKPQKIETNTS